MVFLSGFIVGINIREYADSDFVPVPHKAGPAILFAVIFGGWALRVREEE